MADAPDDMPEAPPKSAPKGLPEGVTVATPVHAQALAAIHRTAFRAPWSAAGLGRMLGQPNMLGLAAHPARDASRIAGFILCRFAAPEAEIVTIAVLPEMRRRGFGRRLVDGMAVFLRRSAVEECFLEVEAGNAAACALYESRGFEPVGVREGYYKAAGERRDALLMRKLLI